MIILIDIRVEATINPARPKTKVKHRQFPL